MKRVISYSLFGTNLFYRRALPAILRAANVIFPGWEVRIYHNSDIGSVNYDNVLINLARKGLIKLVYIEQPAILCKAMLWRLLPIWDKDTEYVICRDIDALLMPRERIAVEQFIESGAPAHCISDHFMHGVHMMGGTVGFNTTKFIEITKFMNFDDLLIKSGFTDDMLSIKGSDQDLLGQHVWPLIESTVCEHRTDGRPPAYAGGKSYTTIHSSNTYGMNDEIIDVGNKIVPFIGIHRFDPIKAKDFYNRYCDDDFREAIICAESKFNINFDEIARCSIPD